MSRAAVLPFTHSSLVRRVRSEARAELLRASGLNDDLRLFATTFAAGFLFVSLFLA